MPPLPRDARLFVAFRILFNARFYYPVLAVLFVDLGLNLDQYALLNVAWAVSIVLFKLPLGALGDQIGRKPLAVGAGFGALGYFAPAIAERLVCRRTAFQNHLLLIGMVFFGLAGCAVVRHWSGVLFVVPLSFAMRFLSFFASHYLNAVTESSQRATVLSFRSLANNLAYGAAGWGFALLMRSLAGGRRPPAGSDLEEAIFAQAIAYVPVVVLLLGLPLLAWAFAIPRMRAAPMECEE